MPDTSRPSRRGIIPTATSSRDVSARAGRSRPDTYTGDVQASDVFLVASDGLTGMVDDARLQAAAVIPRVAGPAGGCADQRGERAGRPRQHHGCRRAGSVGR